MNIEGKGFIGSNVWQDERISYEIWREIRNCDGK